MGGVAGAAVGGLGAAMGGGGGASSSSQQSSTSSQESWNREAQYGPTRAGYVSGSSLYDQYGQNAMSSLMGNVKEGTGQASPFYMASYAAMDKLMDSMGIARYKAGSAAYAQHEIDKRAGVFDDKRVLVRDVIPGQPKGANNGVNFGVSQLSYPGDKGVDPLTKLGKNPGPSSSFVGAKYATPDLPAEYRIDKGKGDTFDYSLTDPVEAQQAIVDEVKAQPGYQFGLEEGNRGVTNSAAARGLLQSTAGARNLQKFGDDYATSKFQAYQQQLANIAGMGQQMMTSMNANNLTAATIGAQTQMQQGQNLANMALGATNAWSVSPTTGYSKAQSYSQGTSQSSSGGGGGLGAGLSAFGQGLGGL